MGVVAQANRQDGMTTLPDPPSENWWWRRDHYVSAAIVGGLLVLILWTSVSPAAPLSDEGAGLLAKGALVTAFLLVAALTRTLVGRHPKRQFGMAMGSIGGLVTGVALAAPLSRWIGKDVSALSAIAAVLIGWVVAYQFVKHLPRNGPSRPTPWRTW
jgi:hypothetical protein